MLADKIHIFLHHGNQPLIVLYILDRVAALLDGNLNAGAESRPLGAAVHDLHDLLHVLIIQRPDIELADRLFRNNIHRRSALENDPVDSGIIFHMNALAVHRRVHQIHRRHGVRAHPGAGRRMGRLPGKRISHVHRGKRNVVRNGNIVGMHDQRRVHVGENPFLHHGDLSAAVFLRRSP